MELLKISISTSALSSTLKEIQGLLQAFSVRHHAHQEESICVFVENLLMYL